MALPIAAMGCLALLTWTLSRRARKPEGKSAS
jgi:hypothetical protein